MNQLENSHKEDEEVKKKFREALNPAIIILKEVLKDDENNKKLRSVEK